MPVSWPEKPAYFMNAKTNSKINDNSVMWFGIHKNKKMKDIPDDYFQHLLNNDISFRAIKHYSKVFRKLQKQK